MTYNIRTDKLDTCAALLEDCVVGFFAGNSIQTTTHLSFAVLTIVRDINNYYKNIAKIDLDFSTLSDRAAKDSPLRILFQKSQFLIEGYNFSLIDRANFVKHADKEPLADNVLLGNEDSLSLSIALEDFGSFYCALKEKGLCTSVAEMFELPNTKEPKFLTLAVLFYAYYKEYDEAQKAFANQHDYDSFFIALEELKRKYFDIIQQLDLAHGRSKSDQLVLLDSLEHNKKPKPTGPAGWQPR